MPTTPDTTEDALLADIERLRSEFPKTQDLYREVCAVMFFRYGMTPTANKLYQLVRKGSMSAPAEALSSFWSTLRSKARVTIDHADLPDALKEVAGQTLAALWKLAQTESTERFTAQRAEAAAAVDGAKTNQAEAEAKEATALVELDRVRDQLKTTEELGAKLRQDLAAATAAAVSMQARLDEVRGDLVAAHRRADEARQEYVAELEKVAARTRLAEERFEAMEKRALQEIDHERTAAAKAQKTMESERAFAASTVERMRTEYAATLVEMGELREQLAAQKGTLISLVTERDRSSEQLQALRAQLDVAIEKAAAEGARAEHLRAELDALRSAQETKLKDRGRRNGKSSG